MNASAPGWQPDPSGRHEYRYWDGSTWTDDVSDAGMTAVDPVAGPGAGGPTPGDPTSVMSPTAAYGTPAAPGTGDDPPAGSGPGGYGPTGGYPAYGTGPVPPAKPPRSGPSTGLLVGLGLLAVALIAVIAVVLTGGDDDGGDETSSTDTTESSETTDTTEGDTPDTTDGSTDGSIDLGAGDLDFDDPEVRAAIIDLAAEQLVDSGFTQEQAECFAGALIDGIGPERLAEIGESGGDMSSLTPEDMSSMIDAVTDCGITDFPTSAG